MSQEDIQMQQVLEMSKQTAVQDAQIRQNYVSQGPELAEGQDQQLQQAIAASMQTKSPYDPSVEPLPTDQRLREKDTPAGLRNIGNTCYFNSLLQVYFTIPEFVIPILAFKDDSVNAQDVEMQSAEQQQAEDALTKKLVESGKNLIKELQKLFTAMAVSNKKYLDPSGVLKAIVNSQGEQMTIGEEKDIREFNDVLLSRIKDAFEHKVKQEEETKAKAENKESKPEMTQVPEESQRPAALVTQSSFMDAGDQPES